MQLVQDLLSIILEIKMDTADYTWRFSANFLCRGNRQIGTHLQQQKRQKQQSQNTKKELFWGAFQLGHVFS